MKESCGPCICEAQNPAETWNYHNRVWQVPGRERPGSCKNHIGSTWPPLEFLLGDLNSSFYWWNLMLLLFSRAVICNSATPWTAARQAPRPPLSPRVCSPLSTESVMLSNHLICCCPSSSHLQSFPASGSFPMSQLFTSGGQSIGASALVLPVNIQSWFPFRLTGLISLQSKGLSRVLSNTTIQKHQFFSTQLSL